MSEITNLFEKTAQEIFPDTHFYTLVEINGKASSEGGSIVSIVSFPEKKYKDLEHNEDKRIFISYNTKTHRFSSFSRNKSASMFTGEISNKFSSPEFRNKLDEYINVEKIKAIFLG